MLNKYCIEKLSLFFVFVSKPKKEKCHFFNHCHFFVIKFCNIALFIINLNKEKHNDIRKA